VDNRAWSWLHGKKAQMGGEVCVSNSQRLLAAAETENDGRGTAQKLRRGACFVFMCLMCGVCQPANRTSNI
jgi:hypothetical protein